MTPIAQRLSELREVYRRGLLEDTLPFWIEHCVDREHGGFTFALDRDGSRLDTDKGLWQHGRFTWLLSTLYTEVEPRAEWLELAGHGIGFLRAHGFDTDGRMFFSVTRDGRPLRKRRYVFTEAFAAAAFAAYARAAGDARSAEDAVRVWELAQRYATTPGLIPPKLDPEQRPMRGMGWPMISIVTCQILRATVGYEPARATIDAAIEEIRTHFMKPELAAVMEVVGPNGEVLDHFDGRMLNPGHAIEAAWFIMEEARQRGGDAELVRMGTTILDWMWKRGWDTEYGGLLYFRDLHDKPVQEYWHDMKFWWNHNEAIIATLMAYRETGDERYADWHALVHDWSYAHFPDPEHGEWYGYLHRDGRLSVPLKGNLWKGPFHLPRMQLKCWQLIEELEHASNGS
ncbi:MAG: N-acylglucosamine 2-epimerase [bacterium]|nr:N-acylglucosamine 2-epimerase [bacterium]